MRYQTVLLLIPISEGAAVIYMIFLATLGLQQQYQGCRADPTAQMSILMGCESHSCPPSQNPVLINA